MKFSHQWLQEFCNPLVSTSVLIDTLSCAGFEVDAVEPCDQDLALSLKIPPNRGDCLGHLGLAREIAALFKEPLKLNPVRALKAPETAGPLIINQSPDSCLRYLGLQIQTTPAFRLADNVSKKLQVCGQALISPLVDLTHCVMFETGQPLHAFDADTLEGNVIIRKARAGEKITLLNHQTISLLADDLVIADEKKVLALAGIMGSASSLITPTTKNVWLELACFDALTIRKTKRRLNLVTEAGIRFERGLDYDAPFMALQSILHHFQASSGAQILAFNQAQTMAPAFKIVQLRWQKVLDLLGQDLDLESQAVPTLLGRLGFELKEAVGSDPAWMVTIPRHRPDVEQEIDLIEEITRLCGLNSIPRQKLTLSLQSIKPTASAALDYRRRLEDRLVDWGYHEALTYSFIPSRLEACFTKPNQSAIDLLNPLSHELSTLRTSLVPGLCKALAFNVHRQQKQLSLFEIGKVFLADSPGESLAIAGVRVGSRHTPNWAHAPQPIDFFDLKGDVEALLKMSHAPGPLSWRPLDLPGFVSQQSGGLYQEEQLIAHAGQVETRVLEFLELKHIAVWAFELCLSKALTFKTIPPVQPWSKYPAIHWDLSFWAPAALPVEHLVQSLKALLQETVRSIIVFDVYQDLKNNPEFKSIGLNLCFQKQSGTLLEAEIRQQVYQAVEILSTNLNVQLRDQ